MKIVASFTVMGFLYTENLGCYFYITCIVLSCTDLSRTMLSTLLYHYVLLYCTMPWIISYTNHMENNHVK